MEKSFLYTLLIVVIVIMYVLYKMLWSSSSTPDNKDNDIWTPERIKELEVALGKKLSTSGVHETDKQLDCMVKWIVDNYTHSQVAKKGFTLSAEDKVKIYERCK